MTYFRTQPHVAFNVRYIPPTDSREARLKVFCSVSTETAIYGYHSMTDGPKDPNVCAIGQFLQDKPLKYYIVREDTIKRITNPSGKDALYIAEAFHKP